MSRFLGIWVGQVVTLAGSALTAFALGLRVYQQTGSVSRFGLVALVTVVPAIAVTPIAGIAADHWSRRWIMIAGEAGAAAATLWLALVAHADQLTLWTIYLAVSIISACVAVEMPAYLALITQLVREEQFGRTAGLLQLGPSAAELLSPLLAAYLVTTVHLQGVLIVDFVTYIFAITMLLAVRVPSRTALPASAAEGGSLLVQAAFGWRYIAARPVLVTLSTFFAATSFVGGMVTVLIVPLVLGLGSVHVLGTILSIAGSGLLAGGMVMSVWGGPRRRIAGVLGLELTAGLCLIVMGLRPVIGLVAVGAFGVHFAAPIVNGCNQAIWQRAVPAELQGRVFAARQMVTVAPRPLAYLTAGPLADKVFDPFLSSHGLLADTVGRVIVNGPGRGIALIFLVLGFSNVLLTGAAMLLLSDGAGSR